MIQLDFPRRYEVAIFDETGVRKICKGVLKFPKAGPVIVVSGYSKRLLQKQDSIKFTGRATNGYAVENGYARIEGFLPNGAIKIRIRDIRFRDR